jgi:hypothetical protein
MDANTVIAICSAVIATGALSVSVIEGRAARRHNRHSVRPLLQLWHVRRDGWAGLQLLNCGLGPAIITRTLLALDGNAAGGWNRTDVAGIYAMCDPQLKTTASVKLTVLLDGRVIPVGYDDFLLRLNDYDPYGDPAGFWEVLRDRVYLEIHYESLYGERFVTSTGERSPVPRAARVDPQAANAGQEQPVSLHGQSSRDQPPSSLSRGAGTIGGTWAAGKAGASAALIRVRCVGARLLS